MKRNLLWLLGLTVAAGLIVPGCGGGGDDSTSAGQSDTTASAISKEDFIAQADQICADGNKQAQQQLQQQFGNGNVTADQLPAVAKAVSDSIKNQVSQIRALGAPEGDEDTINSFLDSAEKGANEMAQDPSQIQAQGDPNADVAKANQEAKAYGLKVCGQS